jgi:hypothetical protein
VGWLIEPSGINPDIYSDSYLKDFDYMLTFDRKLIACNPEKILFYPFGCCWVKPQDWGMHEKTRLVSMVCSGKAHCDGHRFRNKIYDVFAHKFDGYGRYRNPIENKGDALKDYMYSICVQNTKADDYFTEILTDCFMTGTIPIYWGTDNIGKYFNSDGIIPFSSIAELDEILKGLTIEGYHKRKNAMKENFDRAQTFFSPEDYIYEHYPYLFKGML